MNPQTRQAISDGIVAAFRVADPTSRSMALTVGRLMPADSDAWFVQAEGDEVAVYVLFGSAIHEVRGKRVAPPPENVPPPMARAACSYRVLKVTPDATFSCNVTQTESGDGSEVKEIDEVWKFDLGAGCTIEIACKPPLPAGNHRFAVALVAAINARQTDPAA
jgi:hypothetical protein